MDKSVNASICSCDANKTDGIILGKDITGSSENQVLVYQNETATGANFFAFGSASCGKSYSFIAPNLLQAGKRGESIVVLDERGEHLDSTRSYFEKLGYDVKVVNMFEPTKSDRWNLMKVLDMGHDEVTNAIDLASIFISCENPYDFNESTESMRKAQIALLAAILLHVHHSNNFRDTFKSVMDIINHPGGVSYLNELFAEGKTSDKYREMYQMFLWHASNLQANYLHDLGNMMMKYSDEEFMAIVNSDESDNIDFNALSEKPCIYYVLPNTRAGFYSFETVFIYFALKSIQERHLKTVTDENLIPVNIFIDSLQNCGSIPNLDTTIVACNKVGTNTFLTAHWLDLLRSKYPSNWKKILENCNALLGMGFNDLDTALLFSEQIKKAPNSNRLNLEMADNLLKLDANKLLIVFSDKTSTMIDKYPVSSLTTQKQVD